MSVVVASTPARGNHTVSLWLRAGLIAGITDMLFSSVLNAVFYGSTVARLWQGVASVLIGKSAIDGDVQPVALGLMLHFTVALSWTAVFLFVLMRASHVQALLASPFGTIKTATLFGPIIWMFMSFAFMPSFTHRPPTVNFRWWVQLFGHIPFVALPIVKVIAQSFSLARHEDTK